LVLGTGIALVNLVSVQFIRIPETKAGLFAAWPPESVSSNLSAAHIK